MRNKHAILLVIFCHLLMTGLTAQDVSKKNFDSAVDYVICKFAEFSLKKANKVESFNDKCNCEKIPSYEKIENAIPSDIPATIALVKEIQKFKREYNSNLNKQDAIDLILTKMINDDRYKKIKQFDSSKKDDAGYQALKKSLESTVYGIINGMNRPPGINQTSGDEDSTGATVSPPATVERDSVKWLPFILFFLMSLIFSIVFFVLFGVPMIQNKMQLVMEKERNDRAIGLSGIENRLNNLEEHYRQLNSDIEGLRRDIKDAQRVELKNISNPSSIPTPETVEEVIFFPSPNAEGIFSVSHGSISFLEGKTIYKFVKIASNRAQFRIDNRDMAMKLALRSVSNITPVCTSENDFNTSYTRITTIREGIAELEGDKWVVKSNNKAVIRYEY
jgi:hypothetical protein